MPSKKTRKLLIIGNKEKWSEAITLPKDWISFWNLKKGCEIPVLYNSVLIVLPPNHPRLEELCRKASEFLTQNLS